jgi:hypothetical protein
MLFFNAGSNKTNNYFKQLDHIRFYITMTKFKSMEAIFTEKGSLLITGLYKGSHSQKATERSVAHLLENITTLH